MLDTFQKICGEVNDLELKHITFDTKETFISSDNLITIINHYVNNIGFGIKRLVILFPYLLWIYVFKIYTKLNSFNRLCKSKYIMEILNVLFFANAKSIIYSIGPFFKKLFKQTNKKLRIKILSIQMFQLLERKKEDFVVIGREY